MIALGLMVSDKNYVIMMKIKLMGPGLANSHSDQTVRPSSDILHTSLTNTSKTQLFRLKQTSKYYFFGRFSARTQKLTV